MLATTIMICLVVGVADGDTLTARCPTQSDTHPYEQVRVRVAGIDAPERGQPFGQKAKQAMSDLAYRQQVKLDCRKRDRFGRLVCDVHVKAGPQAGGYEVDAGLRLVEQGMAWWYRAFAREQTAGQRRQYEAAEDRARKAQAGLWRDQQPIAPWQWRKAR
jgi:endonuclease YncB( thermonuclease family)